MKTVSSSFWAGLTIKSRSVAYGVEPGEVEATLLTLPEIDAAVVKLCPDATDTPRLTAYLVGSSETPVRDTDRVRAALEKQIPRHMIPERFVWLDAMPMTPNGKIDRKALPALPQDEICLSDALSADH